MQDFEYANPTTVQEAVALLGTNWGEAEVLAGGTDLISLMKEYLETPEARGEHQEHQGTRRHLRKTGEACASAPLVTFDELANNAAVRTAIPVARPPPCAESPARRSATWGRSAATFASGRAAGITAPGYGLLANEGRQEPGPER